MIKKSLLILVALALSLQTAPMRSQDNQAELLLGGQPLESVVEPGSVSTDKSGNVYLYCHGTNEIFCFSKDFKLKFKFGGYGFTEETFIDPSDILVIKDYILVSDVGMLKVFDLSGNFKKNITRFKDVELKNPCGLSVDTRGKIYVCDPDIGKIFILESSLEPYKIIDNFKSPMAIVPANDGYFLLEQETKSVLILSGAMAKIKTIGPFKNPMCLTSDYTQKLYILDDNQVKIYTFGGIPSKTMSFAPKTATGRYSSIAIDNGKALVSSTDTHELLQLDETGKVTVKLEHDPEKLCLPSGFAIDENGRIFISDSGNGTIRVIDQKGNPLYKIDQNLPTSKIAISKDLVSIVNDKTVLLTTRVGEKAFEIPEADAIDTDFEPNGTILVLKKDSVLRYNGSEKIDTVLEKQTWNKPTSISSIGTHFAVTDFYDSRIMIFDSTGKLTNSMTLNDSPTDCIMLSEHRIIVCCESSVILVDHSGKILRSFGKDDGPFTAHKPSNEKIAYDSNLDSFTYPVAIARFGQWIYTLDMMAMRLVRFPKEMLLESPKIKINPEIVDFKYVLQDSEEDQEIVIQNIGGDSLEGYFTQIPKWISLSTRIVKGDEVIVKVKAKTLHFIPNMTYMENLVLESNAGRFVIPCVLKIPESMPQQMDVGFQVGVKTITVNGKKIDMPTAPYIKDGSTMIPLQFITSSFGGAAEFDSGYVSVNFPRKNIWVVCEIGSESVTMQRDDQTSSLSMKPAPELKSGKPCLPLSFFTDILDCEVYWDKATKKIRLVYLP
ncbi:MAG: hypothetical protein KA140_04845 [Caldisericia bacterium]|nr:hypothetical protein [Caldisericia bacterium]